ncbi:MAG TPA: ATP-grasp domain-containing protein [Gemmatimonadaceae bacterium]|nr:ATP-grasp domain-containing protein [Gemmatimonadaceae bacterium]
MAAPRTVLLAGVSTRAMAESAARAGWRVIALDAFGDMDQREVADCRALPRDLGVRWSAAACARAAAGIAADAVAYCSDLENHPRAVRALAAGRALLGNAPETLARARDPVLVSRALCDRGFAAPRVRLRAPAERDGAAWLRKRRASGGGRGVAPWTGEDAGRGWYLQERVDGVPGSVTFAARGGRITPLAVTRQLVGEEAFGARGLRYCGSILAPAADPHFARGEALHAAALALAAAAAESLGLAGVNGIDFIARDGVPHPIEVNPRWTASMELAERAWGVSVFELHAAMWEGLGGSVAAPRFPLTTLGAPPPTTTIVPNSAGRGIESPRRASLPDPRPLIPDPRLSHGKAILFARRTVVLGDTRGWLEDDDIRDVPHPRERIARGHPICTIFARGRDAAACHASLVRRAGEVYAMVERMQGVKSMRRRSA